MENFKILDTNVLIYDHNALNNYPNSTIVIPLSVIKELDKFKRHPSHGPGVRSVIRQLDQIMDQPHRELKIKEQVKKVYQINESSSLIIEYNHLEELPQQFIQDVHADTKILAVAYFYHKHYENVEFICNDFNLRVQAKSLEINTHEYQGFVHVSEEESDYKGYKILEVNETLFKSLKQQDKEILINEYKELEELNLVENQYLLIKNNKKDLKFQYKKSYQNNKEVSDKNYLKPLNQEISTWHNVIRPKNIAQFFAIHALTDPDIKLITLAGKAGTGKTLLAIAAGVDQVLHEQKYKNVLISRPTVPLPNNDIGFLPGDINEKMNPWLKPIYDNLKLLFSGDSNSKENKLNQLEDQNIEVEPLMHIRGRSIPFQYIIIDEAQNLTPHEIKTIITRAGEGTKIVFTGDPDQIDSPYLNSLNNGLTQVAEQFREKGKGLYAHVKLTQGERSELAELASNILK